MTKEIQVINIQIPELKRIAQVEGDQDNWLIFESLSEHYREAKPAEQRPSRPFRGVLSYAYREAWRWRRFAETTWC